LALLTAATTTTTIFTTFTTITTTAIRTGRLWVPGKGQQTAAGVAAVATLACFLLHLLLLQSCWCGVYRVLRVGGMVRLLGRVLRRRGGCECGCNWCGSEVVSIPADVAARLVVEAVGVVVVGGVAVVVLLPSVGCFGEVSRGRWWWWLLLLRIVMMRHR
jgi:hypothetical protein